MKILHVIDNLKLGGTQHLAVRTWNELVTKGHDVEACVLVNSANEHKWTELPFKMYRLGCHGDYRRPFAIGKWAKHLADVVEQTKPDVIHSWLWLSDIVSANAAARCRVPHVVHLVDRRNWQQSQRLRDRYRRWATRRAFEKAGSSFLAVSQAAAQFAVESLGIHADRVEVAYNSIHTQKFSEIPDCDAWGESVRPLRLGIAARIEPEKGHKYLIEAIRLLRTKGISCTLQITGDGTDRLELERLVLENDLSEMVQFVGWVVDVAEFLTGIDVFLVPSIDSEGLPTTILEAMAAGRVVIATDVGGATEAIDHQKTGFIVKPKDANAIADAIEALSANRELAGIVAQNARVTINEKFSMPGMIQTIENMYGRVCREENRTC
jgi:glycosyltransferase involved in cell wall biosynthesis